MAKKNLPVTVSIGDYARSAYLGYAMSVVKGRAIPAVQDGLKPVQRRILYSMHQLGLKPSGAPMKSARVVGDTLGKYHPHGDGATYEAMVRMSQHFSLRYPLVHGEGNFGSRDGDNAAAYRYTEAKLTPIAETLLSELNWDTVDFQPNYDGKEREPRTLPARLPFLLLNGASGIGVGLATEFPSHQLNEVVEGAKLILQNPKATLDDLMDKIPGPDYPTGGQLISTPEEIRKVYKAGQGSLRLRARWRVEDDGKSWKLVFYEIPQTTNTEKVMMEISELIDPKPREKKGKKLPLTPEQNRLKKIFSEWIDDYLDQSDEEHPTCLVITPKQRKSDPEQIAIALCGHTSLEENVPLNFVSVDENGLPTSGNLLIWLTQWCSYRVETVRRRLTDEKRRIDHRLHILAGRLSILDVIHDVVRLLTTSEDPKKDLMSTYSLDDIQAEDILEMKLRSLARLEKVKLEEESGKLAPESLRLGQLLGNDASLKKLVVKELDQDAKNYGDTRRTLIKSETAISTHTVVQELTQDHASSETIAIAVSERGWISWKPAKSIDEAVGIDFKLKAGDAVKNIFFGTRADILLGLDTSGRGFSLNLSDLAARTDSAPLTTWFETSTRIAEVVLGKSGQQFLVSHSGGYGFVLPVQDWVNRMKAGKSLVTLKDGEILHPPLPVPADGDTWVCAALSSDGRLVAFPGKDVKVLPKGRGVGLMGLGDGCSMTGITLVSESGVVQLKDSTGKTAIVSSDEMSKLYGPRAAGRRGRGPHKKGAWIGFSEVRDA